MTFATHLERQFMQRLRGAGWVKPSAARSRARTLLSDYPAKAGSIPRLSKN